MDVVVSGRAILARKRGKKVHSKGVYSTISKRNGFEKPLSIKPSMTVFSNQIIRYVGGIPTVSDEIFARLAWFYVFENRMFPTCRAIFAPMRLQDMFNVPVNYSGVLVALVFDAIGTARHQYDIIQIGVARSMASLGESRYVG